MHWLPSPASSGCRPWPQHDLHLYHLCSAVLGRHGAYRPQPDPDPEGERVRYRCPRTGASSGRIIKKHLLTNCIGTLIVTTTLQIPASIFTESYLSFIGLGVAAPLPSLGSLATDAVKGMNTYPHLLIAPALMISVMILVFNLFGDGLRDAFDPKLKN